MNHQTARWVFALSVGILVAFLSYRWITDPVPREERVFQDAAISSARAYLQFHVDSHIDIVDPWSPDRAVGKSYVFRTDGGWEVSGYYRRGEQDPWHPFLIRMDEEGSMTHLKVQDPAIAGNDNPLLEVLP